MEAAMSDLQSPDPNQDFRQYLREELARRCQKNTQFSLRGFARMLEIEPSSLSKLLNGKRRITEAMLVRLAQKLNIPGADLAKYRNSQAQVGDTLQPSETIH
jgi:transcriptional regulator with XRE-family HTH domain